MSKKLLFIFNPHSGKGLIKNSLVEIVDLMVKADFEVTIYTTQAPGDAINKVEAEAKNFDRIICSGGDGTLDEVITGLNKSGEKVPVGYIPAGSTNDFANSLGLPKDMVEAAKIAVSDDLFPCDMGTFNDDTFVYVAAFGLFSAVSYQTSQSLKNILGHAAYILQGAKELIGIPSYHLKIEHDGEVIEGDYILGMITNSISVGGFKGMTGSDVLLDDGLFEATFIRKPKNPLELNAILASLTNLIDDTDMIDTFKTSSLGLISTEGIEWTLDGEYGGNHDEVIIKNLHKHVEMVVKR